MNRRALHARRRWAQANKQAWLCAHASCSKSFIALDFDLWGPGQLAYCRSCRLRLDAPARIAKALETRRARAAQRELFAKVTSKVVEDAKRRPRRRASRARRSSS